MTVDYFLKEISKLTKREPSHFGWECTLRWERYSRKRFIVAVSSFSWGYSRCFHAIVFPSNLHRIVLSAFLYDYRGKYIPDRLRQLRTCTINVLRNDPQNEIDDLEREIFSWEINWPKEKVEVVGLKKFLGVGSPSNIAQLENYYGARAVLEFFTKRVHRKTGNLLGDPVRSAIEIVNKWLNRMLNDEFWTIPPGYSYTVTPRPVGDPKRVPIPLNDDRKRQIINYWLGRIGRLVKDYSEWLKINFSVYNK